jgi:AcrR family transcriptional regulator
MGGSVLSLVQRHDAKTFGGARPLGDAATPSALSGASEQRVRIVEATLACIGRFGLAKTTLDDVARQSGYSRATLYRAFPGGKEALLMAVVDTEVSRLYTELALSMGEAASLEEALVAGTTLAARRIMGHDVLWMLLEHEPEVVLPHLAFDHRDRLLGEVSVFVAPFLGRWLAHDEALRVAEWATRITLSYIECPAESIDLTEVADVRRLMQTYVLPGISVVSASAEGAVPVVPAAPAGIAVTRSVTSKGEAS